MSGALAGKRAFITGSISGIGLGIASVFAREGAAIVLHGLGSQTVVDDAVAKIKAAGGTLVESYISDLRNSDETEQLIGEVLKHGEIDILVNNAGIQHTAVVTEMAREKWNDILAVNLSSYFDTMRLVLPQMKQRGHGRVINIASVHGLVASIAKAPYVAAKHGVVGLTKVAALEFAAIGNRENGGLTINAICPGWVNTTLIEPQIQVKVTEHNGDRAAGIADLLSEKQPSLRMSETSDIGELALWLCNKAAHNITGAALTVDGGWSAQ